MAGCDSFGERFRNEPEHYFDSFEDWKNRTGIKIKTKTDFLNNFEGYFNITNYGAYVPKCLDELDLWNEAYKEYKKFKQDKRDYEFRKKQRRMNENINAKMKAIQEGKIYRAKPIEQHFIKTTPAYKRKITGKERQVKSYTRTYSSWQKKELNAIARFQHEGLKTKESYNKFSELGYKKTYNAFKTKLSRLSKA